MRPFNVARQLLERLERSVSPTLADRRSIAAPEGERHPLSVAGVPAEREPTELMALRHPPRSRRIGGPELILVDHADPGRRQARRQWIGEDILHPARWAWIAADGADQTSWILTVGVLGTRILAYVLLKPRFSDGGESP